MTAMFGMDPGVRLRLRPRKAYSKRALYKECRNQLDTIQYANIENNSLRQLVDAYAKEGFWSFLRRYVGRGLAWAFKIGGKK
jgi:hypothetical protein